QLDEARPRASDGEAGEVGEEAAELALDAADGARADARGGPRAAGEAAARVAAQVVGDVLEQVAAEAHAEQAPVVPVGAEEEAEVAERGEREIVVGARAPVAVAEVHLAVGA